jgi:LPS sulfotransferase NodH
MREKAGAKFSSFSERYDFPRFDGSPKAYLLATVPRCGSHFLGHIMWSTGRLGAPLEYLKPNRLSLWQNHYSALDVKSTIKEMLTFRSSPNGIFGAKSHWPAFQALLEQPDCIGLFDFKYFILVERKNIVAQAVSLTIARQTSSWISSQPASTAPIYNRAEIKSSLMEIQRQSRAWENYFSENQIVPCKIYYEDVLENREEQVRRIFEFLELDEFWSFNDRLWRPSMQRSKLNDEWVEQYCVGK